MYLEVLMLPTMTWRWGFDLLLLDVNNSLGREQNACWLAGTAGVLGIAGNMLTISVSLSLLVALLLHFHPLISHQRLTWEMWGYNCVLLTIPTFSLSLSSLPGDWVWTCFKLPLFPLPLTILDILLFHLLIPTFFFPPPSLGCLLSRIHGLLINNPPSCFSAFCISSGSLCLTSTLKRMSDSLSSYGAIFIQLHHSRDVTSRRTSFFPLPPYGVSSLLLYLHFSAESLRSSLTKKFCGHVSLSPLARNGKRLLFDYFD